MCAMIVLSIPQMLLIQTMGSALLLVFIRSSHAPLVVEAQCTSPLSPSCSEGDYPSFSDSDSTTDGIDILLDDDSSSVFPNIEVCATYCEDSESSTDQRAQAIIHSLSSLQVLLSQLSSFQHYAIQFCQELRKCLHSSSL